MAITRITTLENSLPQARSGTLIHTDRRSYPQSRPVRTLRLRKSGREKAAPAPTERGSARKPCKRESSLRIWRTSKSANHAQAIFNFVIDSRLAKRRLVQAFESRVDWESKGLSSPVSDRTSATAPQKNIGTGETSIRDLFRSITSLVQRIRSRTLVKRPDTAKRDTIGYWCWRT
jgi:hypothetical protein